MLTRINNVNRLLLARPFSTAIPMYKESPRERMLRRKELQSLQEKWKLKVGFEFHVQMNTSHKMFSSKLSG